MADFASRLRSAANRCTRVNADVALLCERALDSALELDRISQLRGQFGVAVALLRECIGPLEVSAALIESDDTEQMEALIRRVQKFVADAHGVQACETEQDCQHDPWCRIQGKCRNAGVDAPDGGQQ